MENKTDTYQPFALANEELMRLKKDGVFEMPKIDWWLLKYTELYKANVKKRDFYYGASIFAKEHNPFNTFWQYWDRLDDITRIHRYESYMKEQMREYHEVKDDRNKLKDLMQRNEELMDEIGFFEGAYLDEKEEHTIISMRFEEPVLIRNENFIHTRTFIKIYHKLFWHDKILPESYKKMEEEMNKTPRISRPSGP